MNTLKKFFVVGMYGGAALYTISGTVYDADGSTAVSGATVALGAYSDVSAGDGTYTITGIPAGTSGSMTCTKTGYLWSAKTISAMSGNLTGQDYTNTWYAAAGCYGDVVAAYAAVGAASQAASYINLKNPGTYDITTADAPTWDTVNGWNFGAVLDTNILNTGIAVSNAYTVFVVVNITGVGGGNFGQVFSAAGDTYHCLPNSGVGNRYYANGGGDLTIAGGQTGAHSFAIANTNVYLDGADDGDVSVSALGAGNLTLGNRDTTFNRNMFGTMQYALIANATLTPAQIAMLDAALVP